MIIYMATNMINGKSYIGQTVQSLSKRKRQHVWRALNKGDKYYFHNAIRKYDQENFDWVIIDECNTIEELNRLEIYYIGLYNTFGKGYNLTIGGGGGTGHKVSKESRQKMSEAKKGKPSWNKGKKLSTIHKKNLAKSHKGKKLTENHKKKMSKNSAEATAVIINDKYFNSMTSAGNYLNVTQPTVKKRILHETRWLNYSYANSADKAYNKR